MPLMRDNRKQIRDWMQAELNRKGYGAKGKLAEYLGIRPEGVTRMLKDEPGKEGREVAADELLKMSEFFGAAPPLPVSAVGSSLNVDVKPGLVPVPMPEGTIRVVGKVAANTWLDVDEMDFGFDDEEPIPAAPGYPISWQFGLRVDGNCLNKIAPHGTRLVCLDVIRAEYDPKPGDLVIVERKRFGGQMVERTAKRLRATAKGFELWPESDDPAHQLPIALEDKPGMDITVNIIGKVLWVMVRP
jgi:hypothetical protein